MQKEKEINWYVWILVILLFFAWNKSHNLEKENVRLHAALEEANSNIDDANSYIEDAQSYAWSSYEDMGYALESLETVENVYESY